MKKLLIALIALALIFGLTACDGDGDSSRTDEKGYLIEQVM